MQELPEKFRIFYFYGAGVAGENFSGEKFSPCPFQKTLGQGLGVQLPECFIVAIVGKWVCALAHRRSRPAVALRVRLRASPSAQDDTRGGNGRPKFGFAPDLLDFRCYFKVRIYAGLPA